MVCDTNTFRRYLKEMRIKSYMKLRRINALCGFSMWPPSKDSLRPTWSPPEADRAQVGPMLAPRILLSGLFVNSISSPCNTRQTVFKSNPPPCCCHIPRACEIIYPGGCYTTYCELLKLIFVMIWIRKWCVYNGSTMCLKIRWCLRNVNHQQQLLHDEVRCLHPKKWNVTKTHLVSSPSVVKYPPFSCQTVPLCPQYPHRLAARPVLSRILTSETTNTYIRYMAEGKLCDFYEMHLNLDDNLPWNALSIHGVPSDTIDDTPELVWRLFLSSFQTSKFEIVVLLICLTLEFASDGWNLVGNF